MVIWLLGCTQTEPEPSPPTVPPDCPEVGDHAVHGRLPSPPAFEISGLAWHNGTLWAHNDNGPTPELFGLTEIGTIDRTVRLDVNGRDLEDLAVHDGTFYLGDIGDNLWERDAVEVFRFAIDSSDAPITPDVLQLTYEDGPRDAETLLVDADGVWVVAKITDGTTGVYRAEGDVLVRHTTLQFGTEPLGQATLVTGGDFSDRGLVLRTYLDEAYLWPTHPGESIATALTRDPCPIALAPEPQGEAIAWSPDGLFTVSEGSEPSLHFHPVLP